MFVYWLGCLGCLGVVIWSERQNKRLFGFERDRLVYIHMWYNQSHWLIYSKSRPIREFYCRVSKSNRRNEFITSFSSVMVKNSRFRLIWFAFVERAIELCKIFARIRFIRLRWLIHEISVELMLSSNFKLSMKFPTVWKYLKLSKFLASFDALDHKCLRPVRHVQHFLFILFIYFSADVSICLLQTRLWQIKSRSVLTLIHAQKSNRKNEREVFVSIGVLVTAMLKLVCSSKIPFKSVSSVFLLIKKSQRKKSLESSQSL